LNQFRETISEKLRIASPPTTDLIKQHILNLNDSILENWKLPESITPTFHKLLEYLGDNWGKHDEPFKKMLQSATFLPIEERRLVKPSRIFFKLKQTLSPFLFQAPRVLAKHESLLKKLGVKDQPSAKDFILLFKVHFSIENFARL
jgi:hypothetical protein